MWKVVIKEWVEDGFNTKKEAFKWANENIYIEEGRDFEVVKVR